MNRFSEEVKIIPRGAWIAAFVMCLGLPLLVMGYIHLTEGEGFLDFAGPELIVLVPIAILFFFYCLLVGYIVGDSKRRGMNSVLWGLLAAFIPNAIGIILYFILRSPLHRSCPQCGAASDGSFAFCTSCGAAISNACPSCRNAVEPGWAHCAKCGCSLKTA